MRWKRWKNTRLFVSDTGVIKRHNYLVPIHTWPNGYQYVQARISGRNRSLSVHRLVAEAFIPNPHGKPQVNHRDGDKTNNRVENLEWNTPSENQKHAVAFLGKCGTGLGDVAVLSESSVAKIRARLIDGDVYSKIAADFGVSNATIGYIASGRTWRHVQNRLEEWREFQRRRLRSPQRLGGSGSANLNARLSTETVAAIRKAATAGATCRQLSEKFGVCPQTVNNVVRRLTYA